MSKNQIIRLVAVILFIVIAGCIANVDTVRRKAIINECTQTVAGSCVSCESRYNKSRHSGQKHFYTIEATYRVDGVTYTARGISYRPYEYGEALGIHYSPDDPSKSYAGTAPVSSETGYAVIAILIVPVMIVGFLTMKR